MVYGMIQGGWGGGLEEGVTPDIDQLGRYVSTSTDITAPAVRTTVNG